MTHNVKTTAELLKALKTFRDGDVIEIAPGDYRLPEAATVTERGKLAGQGKSL